MILVLGGTTEAKQLLERLIEENRHVLVSTAYKFAADYIPKNPLVKHISGRLDCEGLQVLIKDEGIKVVADVTHPYAIEISKNAKEACEKTGVKYIRLERDPSQIDDLVNEGDIYHAVSYEEAAEKACKLGEVIFLATGSNNAAIFKSEADIAGRKTYIRVLPDGGSVEKCTELGFTEDEIITGIGPFSYEDNYKLWKRLGIDVVVTKESGIAGGFAEKLHAAKDLGIKAVVVRRPVGDPEVLRSVNEVVGIMQQLATPGV